MSKDIRSLARDSGRNAGRIKDTVRAIQDQIAAVRRDLEQIISAAEVENQKNVAVLSSLGVVEADMNEIAASNQQILAGAEAILSSMKEAVRGAQQVAAVAEEAGSASAQAAAAARQQARGAEDLAAAIEGDRFARRRHPAPQWLSEARDGPAQIDATRRRGRGCLHGGPIMGAEHEHLVVFRIADDLLGFRLDDVGEIVRLPALAYMPLAPRSLLGLGQPARRGAADRQPDDALLGSPDAPLDEADARDRDRRRRAGRVCRRSDRRLFVTLSAERVEEDDAGAGAVDPDLLDGVVKGAEGDSTIKISESAATAARRVRPARRLRVHAPRPGSRFRLATSAASSCRKQHHGVVGQLRSGSSRNTPCRSTVCERSFRCRIRCRRFRVPRPPCWAW